MSELKYWVWLSSVTGVSALTCRRLLERFESPERVFYADESELAGLDFLSRDARHALLNKKLHKAVEIIDTTIAKGWRILSVSDAIYPDRLRNIPDPPVVLYVRGYLPALDQEAVVGVVGTRNCTEYGKKSARRISEQLAACGCIVATGLARGIDTAAAEGALHGGGKVIGVLGNGLDIIYPRENEKLYSAVAEQGALITEYPPGTSPTGSNFPVRNRIISGLSLGVLVVEAPSRSGASITANLALEQGRDVFVVPGNIDSYASAGSNKLLREGATAIIDGRDIASEYEAFFPDRICLDPIRQRPIKPPDEIRPAPVSQKSVPLPDGLSDTERSICSVLQAGPKHIDEIISQSGLAPGDVMAHLTMLEIAGTVISQDGNYFRLA